MKRFTFEWAIQGGPVVGRLEMVDRGETPGEGGGDGGPAGWVRVAGERS